MTDIAERLRGPEPVAWRVSNPYGPGWAIYQSLEAAMIHALQGGCEVQALYVCSVHFPVPSLSPAVSPD